MAQQVKPPHVMLTFCSGVPIWVPATLILVQLPADAPWKVAEDLAPCQCACENRGIWFKYLEPCHPPGYWMEV